MKNKKILTILSVLMLIPLLLGAKFLDVQLKGADKPFVDLSVILKNGGNYLPNNMKAIAEDPSSDDSVSSTAYEPAFANNELTIRVKSAAVFLNDQPANGKPYTVQIKEAYDSGRTKILLVDDYAEYKTYKAVIEFLNGEGIRYDEKTEK